MKAIGIRQPIAEFLLTGLTQYFVTNTVTELGEILIWVTEEEICLEVLEAKGIETLDPKLLQELSVVFSDALAAPCYGCLVAIAEITEIQWITQPVIDKLEPLDLVLQPWSPGGYAWKLKAKEVFSYPMPCNGSEGIFFKPFYDPRIGESR